MLTKAFIPYGGYYSTPFARWQGTLANENAITLGAETSTRWLAQKKWDPKIFDYLILGITIGQPKLFYGGPWASALIGATDTPGVVVSQACSTATTCIYQAGVGVETDLYQNAYTLMVDRCSNGPHTIWPNPTGPGGTVVSENWVMDHFSLDPWGGTAMIQTAENVAAEAGISREQCDAVTLRRYEQYTDALADDRAFQKRYMFPIEVKVSRKKTILVEADEGVMETTAEDFLDLFRSTAAYEILSGRARGRSRIVSDGELLRCFRAFLLLAQKFCIDRGEEGPDVDDLEVNPFAFRQQRLVPLDGRGRLQTATRALPPRPIRRGNV